MQATLERLRARRDERGDEGGFTLIELLIVIVILAILAAIVVFAVQNLTSSSAKASCESDAQTTDHAVQAFFAQVGAYPNSVKELQAAAGSVKLSDGTMNTGPWLHNTPTNGTNYAIELDGNVVTGAGPTYTVGAIVPATTSNGGATNPGPPVVPGAQVDVLGKWNGTAWASNTAYNPPTVNAATACANL